MTLVKATVTFKGLTKHPERPTPDIIHQFFPEPETKDKAKALLQENGFAVTTESDLTISIRGSKEDFERLFGTGIRRSSTWDFTDLPFEGFTPTKKKAFEFFKWEVEEPPNWEEQEEWSEVIDAITIQQPYYFQNNRFSKEGCFFPSLATFHHLRLPGDVSMVLNASKVHREGVTGKGVKVVMLDSGFNFEHHHFEEHGYSVEQKIGPGASDTIYDPKGHGTAMAANLLAVAPGVDFTGIKLLHDTEEDSSATLAEGFEAALKEEPDVISLSLSFDLAYGNIDRTHHGSLADEFKALEGLILLAISRGITVVICAGNGLVGFPAMMQDVIAVGGVYVDANGKMKASDYTSAFTSRIYEGRNVPDVCGLSGMDIVADNRIRGGYIMSPVQKGIELDIEGVHGNDEWAIVGGSSTATAQVAGVCALLLEKNRDLRPHRVKEILQESAREVVIGYANKESSERRVIPAVDHHGPTASGAGLVDAHQAVSIA